MYFEKLLFVYAVFERNIALYNIPHRKAAPIPELLMSIFAPCTSPAR